MLKIRREQMQVLDAAQRHHFADEIAREVRAQHGDECAELNDEALRDAVADGLARASRYGLCKKFSLSMFVQLLFLAADDFDAYPPVHHILNHPEIAPDERIDALLLSMREQDWREIRRRAGKITK